MASATRIPNPKHRRRGTITPALAVALIAAMLALAMVLDRLWLQTAQTELNRAAEASALVAANRLADDHRLLENGRSNHSAPIQQARSQAVEIAAQNLAVGDPVDLDPYADIQFGHLVTGRGNRTLFLEAETAPTTVVVTARRTYSRANPVAMFLRDLTGHDAADVVSTAEATIDNRVIGIRPINRSTAPILPLAILNSDLQGQRDDTWQSQVARGTGLDRFSYDPATNRVLATPDGLPEIVLVSRRTDGSDNEANVCLLDLRTGFRNDRLFRQFEAGCSSDDLRTFGGELRTDQSPLEISASSFITPSVADGLNSVIGQCRIVMLYSPSVGRNGTVVCTELVAGRILSVRPLADGACAMVFQPGVLATRSALWEPSAEPNRYIYKLHLTH